ncbi:P-loop containing nucleoside triphosphate hydrolase protein [Lineolata rhizophorae]|uniref:P-loop containing nucleoside triphosphate hydrolase protein n=1 Tax=Lineolata rhizophorae TaxID=578093 RepID=A0A6A6NWT8_9PEZI|nr:P-loop containing nucleoside triphosphate hydrolase protein [Lineolata rhizophorae]
MVAVQASQLLEAQRDADAEERAAERDGWFRVTNITDLKIYPRRFFEGDGDEFEKRLTERLTERGRDFVALEGTCVRYYDGLAKQMKEPPLDYYRRDMAEWAAVWLPYKESGRVVIDRKTFQDDNHLSQVAIKPNSNALEKILYSLDDQIQQKGKGLVVLLHGTPGSGKTLTAECAAEITQKTFLTASLAQALRYASIWKAAILLDEADVFFEARKADVADAAERNALVAVFLRHLEYFSGIVFLTTNRIHVFDNAMKSRIHFAFGLNGREVTNAINTLRKLAPFEGVPLRLEHIEAILDIRREFDLNDTDFMRMWNSPTYEDDLDQSKVMCSLGDNRL